METVARRLEGVSSALLGGGFARPLEADAASAVADADSIAEQQMRRMERQAGVLERTAAELMQRS
jgi:hypothetical protein